MWSRVHDTYLWIKWTVVGWLVPAWVPDVDRPGDDDQFARWLDDKEVTDGKA